VEPVLDDAALEGRLRYMMAHGVKEGLLRRCQDWPGLSSFSLMLAKQGATVPLVRLDGPLAWPYTPRGDGPNAPRWSPPSHSSCPVAPMGEFVSQERRRRLNDWAQAIELEGAATFARVLGRHRVLAQNRCGESSDPTPVRDPSVTRQFASCA
jgi:hypothetical protein